MNDKIDSLRKSSELAEKVQSNEVKIAVRAGEGRVAPCGLKTKPEKRHVDFPNAEGMKKRRLTSDKADELKVKSKRPLRKGRHWNKKEVGRTSKITDWFYKDASHNAGTESMARVEEEEKPDMGEDGVHCDVVTYSNVIPNASVCCHNTETSNVCICCRIMTRNEGNGTSTDSSSPEEVGEEKRDFLGELEAVSQTNSPTTSKGERTIRKK